MRIQVVHCHPLEESFDHALYLAIVSTLRAAGHDVVATDLYREGFSPVMTEDERKSYMDNNYRSGGVRDYLEALRSAQGVVFVYPHWWLSMPAMLKGYLDRVWAPGTAFLYDTQDRHIEPNLRHIRLLGVVTSFGSPWWFIRLVAGDPGRKVLRHALQPLCARDVATVWMALYDMDKATEAQRDGFMGRVRDRFSQIPL